MNTHCDGCGEMLSEWDYMAECGHILCGSKCYNQNHKTCPICKKPCQFVLIGEKMPANGSGYLKPVRAIFHDGETILSVNHPCVQALREM